MRQKTAPAGIRHFIGVDGCTAGWVAVHAGDGEELRAELIPSGQLERLCPRDGSCALVWIDIPIGLPDHLWRLGKADGTRECDRAARRLLGWPRSSSVFSPPSRGALGAAHIHGLKAGLTSAQRRSVHRKVSAENKRDTGIKLSMQALGILDKVREMDAEWFDLRLDPAAVCMWEAHPEVCFCAMNEYEPMQHSKRAKGGLGQEERLALLESVCPGSRPFVQDALQRHPRSAFAPDDIVDALALAVSALRGYPDHYAVLPAEPEKDSLGLPMEMVYWLRRG